MHICTTRDILFLKLFVLLGRLGRLKPQGPLAGLCLELRGVVGLDGLVAGLGLVAQLDAQLRRVDLEKLREGGVSKPHVLGHDHA